MHFHILFNKMQSLFSYFDSTKLESSLFSSVILVCFTFYLRVKLSLVPSWLEFSLRVRLALSLREGLEFFLRVGLGFLFRFRLGICLRVRLGFFFSLRLGIYLRMGVGLPFQLEVGYLFESKVGLPFST